MRTAVVVAAGAAAAAADFHSNDPAPPSAARALPDAAAEGEKPQSFFPFAILLFWLGFILAPRSKFWRKKQDRVSNDSNSDSPDLRPFKP